MEKERCGSAEGKNRLLLHSQMLRHARMTKVWNLVEQTSCLFLRVRQECLTYKEPRPYSSTSAR